MSDPYPFDPAVAAAFLARVGAGERTAAVLGTAGAPSQRAYAHWRRTEPAFAAEVRRLAAVGYFRRSRSGHPRWKGWSEAVADRVLLAVMRGAVLRRLLASDPALPCLSVVARWRREHPDWDGALKVAMQVGRLAREAGRSRARLTPELLDEIGDRIVEGGSLRSVGLEADMPCPATLYKWAARWPEFAAEVERCSQIRDDWLGEQIVDGVLGAIGGIAGIEGPDGLAGFAAGRAAMRPLQLRLNQLSKRPGWKQGR